jgi:hypothetical protein
MENFVTGIFSDWLNEETTSPLGDVSPLLPEIYEDIVSSNLHRIARYPHRRVGYQLPGGYVVFPTMPWTYDYLPLQFPLTQWPASMQTYIIDCKELTVDVGHCDVLPVHIEFADRARRYFIFLRCSQEGHRFSFSRFGKFAWAANCPELSLLIP